MCRTDFDESWECITSWPAIGKCVDCGWFGPGVHEVYQVVDDLWAEEGEGWGIAMEMLLNDGVPDWRDRIEWDYDSALLPDGGTWTKTYLSFDGREVSYERRDHPISARAQDLAGRLPRPIVDQSHICDNCLEARRWLKEWCEAWMYDDYLSDVVEHWQEDEIPHSLATGRLVAAAKNRWRDPRNYRRYEASEVATMVDKSLTFLRASVAA